jgi:uncharacterized repeat protein (TIGR04138 family)
LSDEAPLDFEAIVDSIRQKDPRYLPESYQFVREALDYKMSRLEERRHISGQELLDGVRLLALDRFGPMARSVLNHWGISQGEDVGQIVFHLVDAGVMSKTEEDTLENFRGVIRFDETFDAEYKWY